MPPDQTNPPPARVLLVDDEEAFRRNLQSDLEDLGYEVVMASDGHWGYKLFGESLFDIVLADLGMPGMSGLELVIALKEKSPFTPVVVVSGSGTLQDAIEVIRQGAWDYVIKPVEQLEQLDLVVRRNLERSRLLKENNLHKTQLEAVVAERTRRLIENKEQLRALGDNLPNGMIYQVVREHDGAMHFLYVSAGIERLHGLTAEAVLQDSSRLYNQILEEDKPMVTTAEVESFKSMSVYSVVARFQTSSGAIRWVHLNSAPRHLPDGRVLWDGIEIDITEQKNAEEKQKVLEAQLRQSQKLESLGTLAGGIAHDFNNILVPIIFSAELAKQENPDNVPLQGNLDEIIGAGNRAASLVRQILSFSRQQKQERRHVQLSLVIREVMKLIRSTLPSTIEISSTIQPGMPEVWADPTQMHQVVMNLCTNAAHAMRGQQGKLQVNLNTLNRQVEPPKPYLDLPAGAYLQLVVSDSGHGMDRVTLKRIFEPFFTTKAPGEGTGLGLSVVHGIIKDHGGIISVESEPGHGTTFTIFLPVIEKSAEGPAQVPTEIPRGKGQRIMFVDDEPSICAVAQKIISRLGYQPIIFNSATEAWASIQNGPAAFDLLLCDLTMPVMTGTELARLVLSLYPKMPVILSSGYNATLNEDSLRELGVHELLAKPMDFRTIAVAISRALNPPEACGH